jgi:hypothetical protein
MGDLMYFKGWCWHTNLSPKLEFGK